MKEYIIYLWSGDGSKKEFSIFSKNLNSAIDRAYEMFPKKAISVKEKNE